MTIYTDSFAPADRSRAFVAAATWEFVPTPAVDVNGDPMTVDRSEMVNPDDWSQADLDAWEQAEAEARAEDAAVEAFLNRQDDEARYRDEFWD